MFSTGTLKVEREIERERESKKERLENDEGISFILIYKEAEIFSQAIAGGHPLLTVFESEMWGRGRIEMESEEEE